MSAQLESNTYQMEMFSNLEFDVLNKSVKEYKDSSDRVRKGIFGRLDTVKKEVQALIDENRLEIVKQRTDIELLKSMLENFLKTGNPFTKQDP